MMGKQGRVVQRVVVGLVAALVVAASGGRADAAVGDLLTTVFIPEEAQCPEGIESFHTGSAVAAVPGSKIGFPRVPVALVTSCNREVPLPIEGSELRSLIFFIDPRIGQDASPEVLATLVTSVTPTSGWLALAARPDRGDLLACADEGSGGISLYSIKYSIFDTTPGTATLLRSGPAGSDCNGVAWDQVDEVIYQTGSAGNILRFAQTAGSAATSIPSGCPGNFLDGVTQAGVSLFASCQSDEDGDGTIRQLDKRSTPRGAFVRSFSGQSFSPGELEYDAVSFGMQGKDAIWTKRRSNDVLVAVEMAGGTSGQTVGPPALSPGTCADGTTPDADGDGLLDCWESAATWPDGLPGIDYNGDGTRDLVLCVDANGNGNFGAAGSPERALECASHQHKDLFVEIDFMRFHRPDPVAVNNVVAAFAAAPVTNPDGLPGIRLHVQINDELAHVTRIALVPCTPPGASTDANFDTLKASFFGTAAERQNPNALNAKRLAFRYGIFAHNVVGSTSSGCAEVPGNDFLVTLGSYGGTVTGHTGGVGTTDQQAGTLLHELAHTLNIRHGGGDNVNCKPNYHSVANYTFQFSTPTTPRPLDLSRGEFGPLNESSLAELGALSGFTGLIAFGPPEGTVLKKPVVATVGADGSVDWNLTATIDGVPVARDVNNITSLGCPPSAGEVLAGYNDWANLQYNLRASADFADGAHITIDPVQIGAGTQEITIEDAREMSLDRDGDGVLDIDDNCPGTPNPDQDPAACSMDLKILGVLINARFKGLLGVAMLSSKTLDATTIDPETVQLHGVQENGGAVWSLSVKDSASGVPRCITKNVGGNSRRDLICELEVSQGQLPPGVLRVVLDAKTFDGETVQGAAAVRVHRTPAVDAITQAR